MDESFRLYILFYFINLYFVSILVLMDESFRREGGGFLIDFLVSILVLMDVSFRLNNNPRKSVRMVGFHPCFNGCVFQTN